MRRFLSNYFDLLLTSILRVPNLYIITSDKGGGICDCPRCLFVCLSFSKITQKRVHGLGRNFACRQMSRRGRTDQLLSSIQIIVRMPKPESLKVEDLSNSVKQAPHSEQATGHGMHWRQISFTPRFTPMAREFSGSGRLFVRCTVAELRGDIIAQFSDFGLFPPIQNP